MTDTRNRMTLPIPKFGATDSPYTTISGNTAKNHAPALRVGWQRPEADAIVGHKMWRILVLHRLI